MLACKSALFETGGRKPSISNCRFSTVQVFITSLETLRHFRSTFKMATCRGAGQLVRQFSTSAVRNKLADMPLKLYGIEGRYASALFSAATKQNKLDVVDKEINSFKALMAKENAVREFIYDPSQQRQTKMAAMIKLAQSQKYSDITSNFLGVMAENGRLPKTKGIISAFHMLMRAHRGEIVCSVTTAKPLSASDEKELRAAMEGFAKKGQKLEIEMLVDPSLIGGMVVNIGDKFVDMSIASKMKKYTSLLKEAV
ncbi:ATP synthase subunit O, mitochondrial-like [Ruditapes philippinarum]|uniref:ATP synthase subunit O, mitochondrial-like n=1 Tax=Ruditapes philippinarum TaxID=129788 RepID=UPI00295AF806|nr:ATP synthase subunit O, mitochondrial-like [Ruditapes philippinarum]